MESITIIGPCLNESENIDEYISRVLAVCKKLNLNYKIVLIDDGSTDQTWLKILENSKKDNNILE